MLPRDLLADHMPDSERRLSDVASRRVLAWYALRASRPAWPNAFVDRISHARDALEDALDPLVDEIAQVRVAISEKYDELDAGQPYRVAVYLVVDELVWDTDVSGRVAIYDAFASFVDALRRCGGVEVNLQESQVISGGQFTWQATQATDEWNFANLSHRDA